MTISCLPLYLGMLNFTSLNFAEKVAGRAVEYNGISFLDLPRIMCTRWETAESHDNRMIEPPAMAEMKLNA